jgi:hypothetical protein
MGKQGRTPELFVCSHFPKYSGKERKLNFPVAPDDFPVAPREPEGVTV